MKDRNSGVPSQSGSGQAQAHGAPDTGTAREFIPWPVAGHM